MATNNYIVQEVGEDGSYLFPITYINALVDENGSGITLVQTSGSSTVALVSQKGVTDIVQNATTVINCGEF